MLRKHDTSDTIAEIVNADEINVNNNIAHQDPAGISLSEQFELLQAQFLIQIRDVHKDELSRKVDPETELVHMDAVKEAFTETFSSEKIFAKIDTRYKLDKFLVEKMDMIVPQKIPIGTEMVWKVNRTSPDRVADLVEVEQAAYIVPLRESLRALLRNKDVKYCVDNPRDNENDGVLRNVLDGSFYRTHEFFQENRKALAIILYYDDLEIASPLGSKTSVHKLSMFYWSLANIYPELRSTLQTVNLFAIVKTQFLKKFGVDKILEKFVEEINVLQREGISIEIGQEKFNYKGTLLFVAGDTPASALMGGFKESVAAFRPCRTCFTTRDEWKTSFSEDRFILRNKETHIEQVNNIDQNHLTRQGVEYWKKRYGINRRSALLDIDGFDVTMCLPQDGMHILSEGVIEIATRAFLRYYIYEKEYFSLIDLNDWISRFDFGHLRKNAPSAILQAHLMSDGHLRQSSSQMLALAHALPFFIGERSCENDDSDLEERSDCHGRLLQILNVCLSYEIHQERVDTLERMICVYILIFNRLYPHHIVPKFHFLVHIPRYIRLFGPARQQWCFRFEATHSYYKSLVSVVRNFKNMPQTLSYRHQTLMCSRLNSRSNVSSMKFLYTGDQIFSGQTVVLENLANAHLFYEYLDDNEIAGCQVFRTVEVVIHGTSYKNKSLILLEDVESALPVFGEIKNIYVLKEKVFFLYVPLRTLDYSNTLNAYKIEEASIPAMTEKIMRAKDLIFPHSLLHVKFGQARYVVLLYNCRTEFTG
ncbi:uncharacterized protein [Venturia canescens]|uniref:uncharacterized protein n=1 Tax=Venturia canescens TaxID=32260 RepID=UPI001C9BBE30|nr:uncharacterized protein LOC122416547 [Venturia canescens]